MDGGTRDGKPVELSLHVRTAMWVAERIVGVEFDKEGGCEGMAFVPGGTQYSAEEGAQLAEALSRLQVSK